MSYRKGWAKDGDGPSPPAPPTGDLPLFREPAPPPEPEFEAGITALAATAANHDDDIEALVPVARRLACATADRCITVTELRADGVRLGLLPEQGSGRELSWLGAVFKRAGFVSTPAKRRHKTPGTHGKLVTVWRYEGPSE